MKTNKIFVTLFTFSMALTACSGRETGNEDSHGSGQQNHSESEVMEYMNALKTTSEVNHFYLHYYRYAQKVDDYNKWDVWCWPYSPKAGEGYRFDWKGRTTNANNPEKAASGSAEIDSFGYVVADIDLTKEYSGGWNEDSKTIGGTQTHFYQDDSKAILDEAIGVQIVESDSRTTGSSFWANDTGNVYIYLEQFALENANGGKSYHAFVSQDKVKEPSATPPIDHVDPFDGDDGTNVTFGDKNTLMSISKKQSKNKKHPHFS